jgi:hypothetical protein
LTKAKWLSENEIAVATITGKIYTVKVGKDSMSVPYLERPVLLYSTDSAIWDFAVLKKEQEIIAALDSGKVIAIQVATKQTNVIHVSSFVTNLTCLL